MKSKTFLQSELEKIYSTINNIFIKYEYRTNISTHIIEITPISIFKQNKDYIDLEIELEETFHDLFPKEEILFVTDDSLITVDTPDFEYTGWLLKYNTVPHIKLRTNIIINPIIAGENNYALAA